MQLTDKIWLVGKTGRIGSALDYAIRHSDKAERLISTNREDIDTTDLKEVERFIQTHRPAIIINCAAKRDKLWCEENSDEANNETASTSTEGMTTEQKVEALEQAIFDNRSSARAVEILFELSPETANAHADQLNELLDNSNSLLERAQSALDQLKAQ